MNAVKLLKADHKKVEGLFKEFEATGKGQHAQIFAKVKDELEAHAYVEETILYPAILATGDRELVRLTSEAIQEHIQMKCVLGEMSVAVPDKTKFEPQFVKLIEDVRHHVKEEEASMFPKLEKRFGTKTLDDLGSHMAAEKERFLASAETIYA